MSCQVQSPTSDTKAEESLSYSYFTRSFRSQRFKLLVTSVACCLWPISTASAQSTSTGDDWAVGTNADGNGSASTAATVSVAAPAPGGSTVQHSTAAMPAPISPTTGAGTPGTATPTPANATEYEDTDPTALDAFRTDLDPYGRWIDDSRYGRVWVPDAQVVGSDFAPYVSNGHWALDVDNNWVWESNYPFGGVVFHYGRWVWIDSLGWSWVPGRRYAPAWVVWRVPTDNYAYVGWAPAPPTFVWYGTGLFWLSYYPPLPFVFCPSQYVFYPYFGPYLVHDHRFAATLVQHSVWYSTAPIHGRGYVSPPVARARVPAYSVPTQRVSANPHAAALARPSANSAVAGRAGGAGGSALRSTARPMWDAHPARTGLPRDTARPTTLSRPFAGAGSDSRASRPASFAPRGVQNFGSVPSTRYAPRNGSSSPSYPAPYGGAAPRAYSAPSYSAPSRSYAAPHYSAPSTPAYSAPRSSFGSSFSAPTRSYSAPSFSAPHSSGGGFRGGGGGAFRGGGGHHR